METDSGARRITNDALRWLSRRSSDTPFFLFCNYIEPHLPYNPPERLLKDELQADVSVTQAREINQDQWRYVAGDADMSQQDFEILQRMYRAEIRYLDSQLGNLFDGIDQEYGLDQTALVLVGDHGENIGDHGLMDHQYCIYQTLLDVPLIVRYPPLFESEDTDTLIETRTLYKTLLDVAGIHDEEDNRIAPSLLDEESMPEYTIAEYAAPQPPVEKLDKQYGPLDQSVREYDRALRSVQNDQWKLIEGSDGLRELYDLQTDPNESTPIHNEEIAQELEEYLATRRGSISELSMDETEPTHASTQQLRDLGYL